MNFHLSRLGRGERIAAAGAAALFVCLFFLKWYEVKVPKLFSAFVSAAGYSTSFTGWHSLSDTRWVLLLAILAGLALVVLVASGRRVGPPLAAGALVTALGALATVLVFYRTIVNPPGSSSVSAKLGAYLALAACAVLTWGGYVTVSQHTEQEGGARTDGEGVPVDEEDVPAAP
jgi:O-antigen ligase